MGTGASDPIQQAIRHEMDEMIKDMAAYFGDGVGRRHGPPRPEQGWVVPENPHPTWSLEHLYWEVLSDIAGGPGFVGSDPGCCDCWDDSQQKAAAAIGTPTWRPGNAY